MSEGFDMEALLEQARAMQDQVLAAQAAAAEQVVEGQAGGGVVKVRVGGDMTFHSVTIDPRAVDPDDASMLEDLVLAACNDAVARARSVGQETLDGLDLGGLGGAGLGEGEGGGGGAVGGGALGPGDAGSGGPPEP
ncbi:MAG: YbaB/EbfC family nucleoid-associated protein [Actinomycetota bacterium]|nr:YbaB/EbfC family nucleoid-associated protein [Actinomycetota bacterium]